MKRRSGLQEEDDDNGKDNMNIERLASPPRLPSTGEKHPTTKIKAIKNVDEDTRTTTGMKTTTARSIVDAVDVNDHCKNEKELASTETIQNSKNDKITHRIIQKNEEISKENASSDDDDNNSNLSDTSISDRPGAIAIQGPRFSNNNTTEDETVQYSAEEVETAIQTQEEEDEAEAGKPTIHDPLEAERVMEIAQGISVTFNQSDSQTKWKRLTIILGIFVFILCVVAAVLIAFFVRSNNNSSKSLSPPQSAPPVVATVVSSSPADLPTFGPSIIPSSAPTSDKEQIITLLLEYFADLPASNDQEQALDWIITDPTSLGVIMDEGVTSNNKKRMILERFVLATIYFATYLFPWRNNDLWLSPSSVCQWHGIECEGNATTVEQTYVAGLNLSNNRLLGSIPTGVALMTNMIRLDLTNNALTGTIPTELGSMTSMAYAELAYNDLSGSIPTELGSMASLTWLNLAFNALSGSIPTELGLRTSMISLLLSTNSLSGSIPTELRWMKDLEYLLLENNILTGSIPTEVGLLTSLFFLDLSGNPNLTGTIPSEVLAILPNTTFCFMGDTGLIDIPENCQESR